MPKPVVASSFRRNSFHGVEEASQDYETWDFVTIDATTGKVRVCANDDTILHGLSEGDASGVEDTEAVVHELFPGDILQLDIYDSHTAHDIDASTLEAGQVCGICVVDGEWYADSENGAGGTCIQGAVSFIKSQGPIRDEQYGNTVYRGLFRVLEAVCLTVNGAA